jgi:ankyrin repeat protein
VVLIDSGANIHTKHNDGSTPLHELCAGGKNDMALALIDRGVDLHAKDSLGGTPLHSACTFDKTGTVAMLVDCGADIHTENRNRQTPIQVCSPERTGELRECMYVATHRCLVRSFVSEM